MSSCQATGRLVKVGAVPAVILSQGDPLLCILNIKAIQPNAVSVEQKK
jgi:hypothetical protein